jgi:hypothetical protein
VSFLALFDLPQETPDAHGVSWGPGSLTEANDLLRRAHYLGPLYSGGAELVVAGRRDGEIVACQVWRRPTAWMLPNDGAWLELSRWCLTPAAGPNAGSRCHRASVPLLRDRGARTLVSYSDPSAGHTGALYRACNWLWAPTWHRLRPPPTGQGDWGTGRQEVKDRWAFHVARHDPTRELLVPDDAGALAHWARNATDEERRWAARSPYMGAWVRQPTRRLGVFPGWAASAPSLPAVSAR